VDDHEIVRRGLSVFIQSIDDLILAGEAANGQEAIDFLETEEADVILMDILMPKMGGIEAIEYILKHWPDSKIIAMTSFEEEDLVRDAVSRGAIGFLMKNATITDLTHAIKNANDGIPTLAPEAAKILMNAARQLVEPRIDLTQRELEVLAQMVEGRTNPEIAETLSISRSTVKSHVSNILGKLDVSSRVEAVRLAIEKKII
jgi:NarL family two-component system response regulator LiaR